MYQFLTKYGTMAAFGLGLVITVLFLLIAMSGLEGFNALPDEEEGTTTIFNFGLYAVIALIIICVIASIGFGIWFLATHPKQAVRFGIGFGILLVLFFVLYSVSSSDMTPKMMERAAEYGVNETSSKLISGGLLTVIILAGIAVLSFVVSEVMNLFK